MPTCDTKLEDAEVSRQPLDIGITFHHLGLILSALSGLIAVLVAGYLICQHGLHYSKPTEQKHIIRILFMIPVYAVVSFLSYLNYKHAVYYEVLRDCYEAFAIASFFTLLCNYIAPSLHDQKDYFRGMQTKNWLWPMPWCQKCTGGQDRGVLRKPASGLTLFNLIYLGVFQYCFVRVFFTIVAVCSQAAGRYCENSLNPAFAHIWVMVFEGFSVTFAMYALIQFYHQTRQELAHQRPFMKLLCIKLVIFFCFWQSLVVSFLTSSNGPLKPTPKLAYPDIQTGINSMLICLEMAIFAVLHIFAFPWRGPYGPGSKKNPVTPPPYLGGRFGEKAFIDAFNPWDILKATARGFKWLFIGMRHRKSDVSYQKADGWSTDAAFDGPEADGYVGHRDASTKLQQFGAPKRFNTIPLQGDPQYNGPHSSRPSVSRMQSQDYDDDEPWNSRDVDPDDDPYNPLQRQRGSFEVGAEDRAGLLRHPVMPGRTGISPARSELDDSPERPPRRERRHHNDSSSFDKEAGIDEQYTGYGRNSWGREPPGYSR